MSKPLSVVMLGVPLLGLILYFWCSSLLLSWEQPVTDPRKMSGYAFDTRLPRETLSRFERILFRLPGNTTEMDTFCLIFKKNGSPIGMPAAGLMEVEQQGDGLYWTDGNHFYFSLPNNSSPAEAAASYSVASNLVPRTRLMLIGIGSAIVLLISLVAIFIPKYILTLIMSKSISIIKKVIEIIVSLINLFFPKIRRTRVLLTAFLLVNWAIVIYAAFLLRPSSDDYCWAEGSVKYGAIGSCIIWWNNWTGNLSGLFIMTLSNNFAYDYLPIEYASAVPFLLAMVCVGLIAYLCFPRALDGILKKLVFILTAGMLWWLFLWIYGAIGLPNNYVTYDLYIAEAIAHWQNINGGYITYTMAVLAWYFLIRYLGIKKFDNYQPLVTFLAGAFVGMGGSQNALCFFLFGIFAIAYNVAVGSRKDMILARRRVSLWVIFCISTEAFVFLSHILSPGSTKRLFALGNNHMQFTLPEVAKLIDATIVNSFSYLFSALLNYQSGILLVIVTLVTYLYGDVLLYTGIQRKLLFRCGGFLALAIFMTLSVQFNELLAYHSYWHAIPVVLFLYFAILHLGIFLGISAFSYFGWNRFSMVLILSIFIFLTYINYFALSNIIEREMRWAVGPAPSIAAPDIEEEKGYIRRSWNEYKMFRSVPDRSPKD